MDRHHAGHRPAEAADYATRDARAEQRHQPPHWMFAPLDPLQARYAAQQATWLREQPARRIR